MRRLVVIWMAGVALAFAASVAHAWPGRPVAPPPKPATSAGPPPAWAETVTAAKWLAYAGYCWKTGCADYLPPASRPDLPTLTVRSGGSVRLHLGFTPRSAVVTMLSGASTRTRLALREVVLWRPKRQGIFTVSVKAAAGSVSYAARIRFR